MTVAEIFAVCGIFVLSVECRKWSVGLLRCVAGVGGWVCEANSNDEGKLGGEDGSLLFG